ncbi:hypothetical protein CGZ80_24280 [Rhodopirellula sp. MGV]|nr:hypothetical protein CGZ80_24280 [Rhodopirellula sp. MGV]PNY33790.1 hypothetical protein C2E31_27255 [Rhodopirellula baltica]
MGRNEQNLACKSEGFASREGLCFDSLFDLSLAGRRECRFGRAKRQRLFAKTSKKFLLLDARFRDGGQSLRVMPRNIAVPGAFCPVKGTVCGGVLLVMDTCWLAKKCSIGSRLASR